MSTGATDHANRDPIFTQSRYPFTTSAESSPQQNPQMSEIAHPQSAGPIAGGTALKKTPNTSADGQKTGSPVKTRSLDYILRSGLAGGLAGCAVSVRESPSTRSSRKSGK